MRKQAFWTTAKVLLDYKPRLALAGIGLVISTGCFGAGLTLLLYVFKVLLGSNQSLHDLVQNWAEQHLFHPAKGTLFAHVPPPPYFIDAAHNLIAHLPQDRFRGFIGVMLVIGVLSIIGSCGRYLHELQTVTVALLAGRVWRGRVFRRLIHAPMEQVLESGNADHIARLVIDTGQIAGGYQSIMGKALAEMLKGAAAIVIAFAVNWWLTLIALAGAPIIAVFLRKFGKRIRRTTKRALRQRGHMVAALNESLPGLAVVKVHNAEGYERRRFAGLNRELLNEQMLARQAKALAGPVIDTLALLSVITVSSVAAWLIFRAGNDPLDLIFVLTMLAVAGASLKPLSSLNSDISEAAAAAERILEACALPVEPTGVDTPPNIPDLPRHHQSIRVQNVSFRYPGRDKDAVRNVSLDVPFGTTVAIVGGNGSGKTTLLSLLVHLFKPTSGRVLIDGVDTNSVSLRSLRAQSAVVTQQSILFEGTIADNIAYGRRHTPMDRIVAAAKGAYIDDFITSQPLGYQTLLLEGGKGLSGGQQQRICIARAILRDPAILILDEATSQIDTDSEAKINQALHDLRRGRTIFIIAHRLSTVVDADLIVVMDEGTIVDQGTHDQLLRRCKHYQRFAQMQLRTQDASID